MAEKREYKPGDKVWFARCATTRVWRECPVCFGKLSVTLTLGNGDEVVMPCEYCGAGHPGPIGKVQVYEYEAKPILATVDSVRISEDRSGRKVEYILFGTSVAYEADVFDTETEAVARANELRDKRNKDQFESFLRRKRNGVLGGNYSWAAGYHKREAERCKKEMERHLEAAVICKERARPKNAGGN